MAYWLIDRALPGIVAGLVVSATIAAEHVLMRRHITKVTREQTAALKAPPAPGE